MVEVGDEHGLVHIARTLDLWMENLHGTHICCRQSIIRSILELEVLDLCSGVQNWIWLIVCSTVPSLVTRVSVRRCEDASQSLGLKADVVARR